MQRQVWTAGGKEGGQDSLDLSCSDPRHEDSAGKNHFATWFTFTRRCSGAQGRRRIVFSKEINVFPQVCKSAGTWGAWAGGAVQPGRYGEATTFLIWYVFKKRSLQNRSKWHNLFSGIPEHAGPKGQERFTPGGPWTISINAFVWNNQVFIIKYQMCNIIDYKYL